MKTNQNQPRPAQAEFEKRCRDLMETLGESERARFYGTAGKAILVPEEWSLISPNHNETQIRKSKASRKSQETFERECGDLMNELTESERARFLGTGGKVTFTPDDVVPGFPNHNQTQVRRAK